MYSSLTENNSTNQSSSRNIKAISLNNNPTIFDSQQQQFEHYFNHHDLEYGFDYSWNLNDFKKWCESNYADTFVNKKTGRQQQITDIRWMNLSNGELTSIPEEIGRFVNLKTLKLNYNKITSLPETIGNLTKLTKLVITFNRLTSLPDTIGNLTELSFFDASDNILTSIPETIGNLNKLWWLSICNNKLSYIPETIYNLSNLSHLALMNNRLVGEISESINKLTNLSELILSNNRLTSVPETIGDLSNLKKLFLSTNKLTSIPDSIGKLNKLESLQLQKNYIKSLPVSLSQILPFYDFIYDDFSMKSELLDILDKNVNKNNSCLISTPSHNKNSKIIYSSTDCYIYDSPFPLTEKPSTEISSRETYEKLMRHEEQFSVEELNQIIKQNPFFTDEVKNKFFTNMEYNFLHTICNESFGEICQKIFKRIVGFPQEIQDEIYTKINLEFQKPDRYSIIQEMVFRLVICLNGIDPDVKITMSQDEQLSNIILDIKYDLEKNVDYERLSKFTEIEKEFRRKYNAEEMEGGYSKRKHLQRFEEECRKRGIEEETISEWLEYVKELKSTSEVMDEPYVSCNTFQKCF